MSEPFEPKSGIRWKSILIRFCFAVLIFVGLAILLPNFQLTSNRAPLHGCRANCTNIGTALEMYSTDNKGHYPANLAKLTEGNYLKVIPTCPEAPSMTYTDYQVHQNPDRFSFSCMGNNHAKSYYGFSTSSTNLPQYNSETGLRQPASGYSPPPTEQPR